MKKKKFSYHIRISILICTSSLILAGLGGMAYYLDRKMIATITSEFMVQQEAMIDQESRHLKEVYEKNKDADVDALFTSYVQEEQSGGASYWFLYTPEKILFEKDAMQTTMLEGKSLEDVIKEWVSKEGVNATQANALFHGKTNSTLFSKEKQAAIEIVTANRFEVGEHVYVLGSAIAVPDVLALVNYGNLRFLLYVFVIVIALCVFLFAIWIWRSMKEAKKQETKAMDQLHQHNSERTRMEQELRERRRQVKDFQLMDSLSLFYNREYFYTLLLNMTRQNLKSLGMIVVELSSTHQLILKNGLEAEQQLLSQIKEVILNSLRDENVIARVRDNRIVITVLNDDYHVMSEDCAQLERAIKLLHLPISIKVYSVIQMPNESAMDMYQRIDRIISVS